MAGIVEVDGAGKVDSTGKVDDMGEVDDIGEVDNNKQDGDKDILYYPIITIKGQYKGYGILGQMQEALDRTVLVEPKNFIF